MRVDTTEYEWAHGKKPRGPGLWWFYARREDGQAFQRSFNMSFGEARKAAVRWAKRLGAWSVELQS